jgi:hypothetical protein
MSILKHCKEEIPKEEKEYLRMTKIYFDGFKEEDYQIRNNEIN